ncbi:MAG: right-handed parallel beta-helix repeat-containing protein, partial [Clostridia bacterium]|nr:right-handed parallel beta-helix repeat-containing protein [Clostridia bacterium]
IWFDGNDNVIEYNEFYDLLRESDDAAAIYCGRDYTLGGNIVRYNFFHDMKSDADSHIGIFGMYCDDNLGSCAIEHNVFLRCQSALLLHGGHDMIFRGNLILDACPKSDYSIRVHPYGYWDDLLPGGTHDAGLKRVPWDGEIWRAAYPHLRESPTWDPETEQRFPHYCDISSNAVLRHKPIDVRFAWDDPRFSNRMEHNLILDEAPAGTVKDLCETVLPGMIPGFEPIPFERIGRGKR